MAAIASITLTPPQALDLTSFAQSTGRALELLKPWLSQVNSNSPVIQEIAIQAEAYVQGIQLGVKAAYSGFTVTEDVLFLAEALPADDPEELELYLAGMMQLVKAAYRDATDTYETFRNVRKDLMQLSSRLLSEHEQDNPKHSDGTTINRSVKDLGEEAEALAQFCDNVSSFITWWDWVRIEADSNIHQPDQRINFRIDSLKDPATVQRWQNLRVQYANYVQLVSYIQDQYAITLGPVKPRSAAQISDPVHIFDEPLEDDYAGDSMAQGRSAAYQSKTLSAMGPNKPRSPSTKIGRAPSDEREPGVNKHPIKKALTGSLLFLTKPLTARAHQRNPENKTLGAIILELLKGGWMKLLRPHTGRKQSLP